MTGAQVEDWREVDNDGRFVGRFDFEIEEVRSEERGHAVTLVLRPDRRRYDKVIIKGQPYYRDRFLGHVVPEAEVIRMAQQQAEDAPMYSNPVALKSALGYAEGRKSDLQAELEGGQYKAPLETAAAQRNFSALPIPISLSFISVDICRSTALRRLNGVKYDKAQEMLLRELATVVGQFNASILKITGDGFIAFNDYPAFTTQCDTTVDLGLSLIVVLQASINPALRAAGLPELAIRVGADYGAAVVRSIVVPTTGLTVSEVASDALNRSVKIEQSAATNHFRIGRNLYELLHVQWLERCSRVSFDGHTVGLSEYEVFEVR